MKKLSKDMGKVGAIGIGIGGVCRFKKEHKQIHNVVVQTDKKITKLSDGYYKEAAKGKKVARLLR